MTGVSADAVRRRKLALAGLGAAVLGLSVWWLWPHATAPDDMPAPVSVSASDLFPQQDGEGIYRAVCQACHMANGQGAVGAGHYPALANNPRLEDGGYPALVVVKGLRGMPDLGSRLSDKQVADVVNYVRRSFGNQYRKPISVADVAAVRAGAGR